MFTGIIEELGVVEKKESFGGGFRFRIAAPRSAPELRIHDSVSINGVCHTVIQRDERAFDVESVEETLSKTSLGKLQAGARVNLELPMKLQDRLGGHLVLGHVDTTGVIHSITPRESSWMIGIRVAERFRRYIIPVGSIAIDGVSLTVAVEGADHFQVSIIPHTMENTIFQYYKKGDIVNIEFDLVGKYIERMLHHEGTLPAENGLINEKGLKEQGF